MALVWIPMGRGRDREVDPEVEVLLPADLNQNLGVRQKRKGEAIRKEEIGLVLGLRPRA